MRKNRKFYIIYIDIDIYAAFIYIFWVWKSKSSSFRKLLNHAHVYITKHHVIFGKLSLYMYVFEYLCVCVVYDSTLLQWCWEDVPGISIYIMSQNVFARDLCTIIQKYVPSYIQYIITRTYTWNISCSIWKCCVSIHTYIPIYIMEILNLISTFFFEGIKSSFMFLVKCAHFCIHTEFCCLRIKIYLYICLSLVVQAN